MHHEDHTKLLAQTAAIIFASMRSNASVYKSGVEVSLENRVLMDQAILEAQNLIIKAEGFARTHRLP